MRVDFVDKTLDRPSSSEKKGVWTGRDRTNTLKVVFHMANYLAIRVKKRKQRANRVPRRRRPREVEDAVVRS